MGARIIDMKLQGPYKRSAFWIRATSSRCDGLNPATRQREHSSIFTFDIHAGPRYGLGHITFRGNHGQKISRLVKGGFVDHSERLRIILLLRT